MLKILKKGVLPPAAIRVQAKAPDNTLRVTAARPAPVQPPVPTPGRIVVRGPTQAEHDEALDLVGLKPKPKPIIIAAAKPPEPKGPDPYERISYGTKIKVTNPFFVWVKEYQLGDVGTVVRYHPARLGVTNRGGQTHMNDLYRVELDEPRVEGAGLIVLSRWEFVPLK